MGRKSDILNDDKQQSSEISGTSPDSMRHTSETTPTGVIDENQMDDDDLLIHDTVLPHRKRIRKDPSYYVQSQQSTASYPKIDVSSISFFNSINLVQREKKIFPTTDTYFPFFFRAFSQQQEHPCKIVLERM